MRIKKKEKKGMNFILACRYGDIYEYNKKETENPYLRNINCEFSTYRQKKEVKREKNPLGDTRKKNCETMCNKIGVRTPELKVKREKEGITA